MITEKRYYRIPTPLIDEQKNSVLSKDLYLTETGEIRVEQGTIWDSDCELENNLLAYCTKGSGIVMIYGEQIPITNDQFFIIPKGELFKFYSVLDVNSSFLIAQFNGKKTTQFENEFSVVRNLIPSVNNMVANREMLFDEIFNNLSKGFHDENLEYVNFCFGHLLATFIYANKTSDDIADESSPIIRRVLNYFDKNLDKKLSLNQLAKEIGYSPTYLSTLFKKETNYSPISYFSHLKIVKACELLDYTNMKVKEISFHLGYSDPYYFTKDFKKKMGISPRNYRNRVN